MTLASSRAPQLRRTHFTSLLLWLTALFAFSTLALPTSVSAAPQLILPTPPGEEWKIIQGYACGTHNAWDRYSLDLVQVNGPTYDAPIRAAASGQIWHWEARSGTLILSHGDRFFTMYTHLSRAVSTESGRVFQAGEVLGYAGDRGSPGIPHLHFTAYTANRDGWSGKKSVPLSFAEGYVLPEVGGCSQHQGTVMTAMAIQPPEITFLTDAQPNTWYNQDQRIAFTTNWAGGGLSQMWDVEPSADAPMFPQNVDGYADLSMVGEGMHTLYVRVWGPDGKQTVASYGPVGYDITPPTSPQAQPDLQLNAGSQTIVVWPDVEDAHSGLAGYRIYVGTDPEGEDVWFSEEALVKTPTLAPGTYVVRVQPLDQVGNAGPWTTIRTITVAMP
ncbi:M23 family metallopeptidase [Candidatus Oscillochloris fontis]|uniref:M23 family metallopeptidase n=1 Tax=Candidatus Oscillochloris fontis TaxID=2496868 RepID=UPI00101D5CCF|nr:M23 family metallopeptidase [Candidatus Oscillochloris fontis]